MTVHASPGRLAKGAEAARPVTDRSTLTLAIENMHCGGCMRSVERAALGVRGVETARASLAAKRLSVTYDAASPARLISSPRSSMRALSRRRSRPPSRIAILRARNICSGAWRWLALPP